MSTFSTTITLDVIVSAQDIRNAQPLGFRCTPIDSAVRQILAPGYTTMTTQKELVITGARSIKPIQTFAVPVELSKWMDRHRRGLSVQPIMFRLVLPKQFASDEAIRKTEGPKHVAR